MRIGPAKTMPGKTALGGVSISACLFSEEFDRTHREVFDTALFHD
jgi:hypothetical protein